MNLFEIINRELSDKHLNEFEKVRYIYLRTCEIFSFDSKWHFADLFDDYELLNFIAGRKFDIKDIDDRLVVCYSYTRYILDELLREFTSIDTKIVMGTHCYLIANISGERWILDATMGDLAAVKIGLPTGGFRNDNSNFRKNLEEIDKELGYIYVKRKDILSTMNDLNITEKVYLINQLLSKSNSRYHYSDAHFFLVWLMSSFYLNIKAGTYVNYDYEFHRLIEVLDNQSFFDMSKNEDGEYRIKQINQEDYLILKRNLKHN